MAGYCNILATLWNISDTAAPFMADIIYAYLAKSNPDQTNPVYPPQAARAAYALHEGVSRLRKAYPDMPLLWAPYIHLGP